LTAVAILEDRNADLLIDQLRVSFVTQHIELLEVGQKPGGLVVPPEHRHEGGRLDRRTRGEAQLAQGRVLGAAVLDDDPVALAAAPSHGRWLR